MFIFIGSRSYICKQNMCLKHIDTGFFIIAVLFSVVQNLKVNPRVPESRPMLIEIVKNISRVNNLLEKLVRNFEQEQIDKEDNDQRDVHIASEIKDISDEYNTHKRANSEQQLTTNSLKNMKTTSPHDDLVTVKILEQKRKSHTAHSSNIKVTQYLSAVDGSDSEDEKMMQKEISSAKMLRQAYENACIKVLQRKCNKALEAVLKDVCMSSGKKCAGDFNKGFKKNGATGCERQFDKASLSCRMGHDDSEFGLNRMVLDNSEHNKTDDKTKDFNILRNQYEKACKISNYKKCEAACKYAADKTCKEHECIESKRKAFDKSGEKRCKLSYGVPESDDSDDDDESTGDDDDWS